MNKLNEDSIEQFTLKLLQNIGYKYQYARDIAPDSPQAERQNYSDVILKNRLTQAINTINPHIPPEARKQAQRTITNITASDLINHNAIFHTYLVKRLLREYDYPPNMQALATELVLEQAEVFT